MSLLYNLLNLDGLRITLIVKVIWILYNELASTWITFGLALVRDINNLEGFVGITPLQTLKFFFRAKANIGFSNLVKFSNKGYNSFWYNFKSTPECIPKKNPKF